MKEEIQMIEKNRTWALVDRPINKKVIGVKWVYRVKLNPDGFVNRYKARLVVKGYSQDPGVDFTDTFAPVARLDTIRAILALAAHKGWLVFQLDVKSAFLNGDLKEEIFIDQPDGFVKKNAESKVYLLKKALYGLKQAPRAWYSKLDDYLLKLGFEKSITEPTLYVVKKNEEVLIISVYVDDLLVTGSSLSMVNQFKVKMLQIFEMNDLGKMSYFLGMEVQQTNSGIFIHQKKYSFEILKKFCMHNYKSIAVPLALGSKFMKDDGAAKIDCSIYRSLIGSLLYLYATRPDIVFCVSLLSRFMQSPSEIHLRGAKRILRYIGGTSDYGVKFARVTAVKLLGFSDSDWAGSSEDSRSTSGMCFTLGSGIITWHSKKQSVVAQSTAEAEYIAASMAANHAVWLRKVLFDLNHEKKQPTVLMVDNSAAVAIVRNPVLHDKTKHIWLKYHSIREFEQQAEIQVVQYSSEDQVADIFTKILPKVRFERLRALLGVCSLDSKEEY